MIFILEARALALCSFEGPRKRSLTVSGGYSEGETPLPIPNREVKPLSADGTWLERAWESRSPPFFLSRNVMPAPPIRGGAAHVCSLVARPRGTGHTHTWVRGATAPGRRR